MQVKAYTPFRKVYYAVLLFATALITGTVGYMVIEHLIAMGSVEELGKLKDLVKYRLLCVVMAT